MGRRSRHERRRPCYRLLRQPSHSHSLLLKSPGNNRRNLSIMSRTSSLFTCGQFGPIESAKTAHLRAYPVALPNRYVLQEFTEPKQSWSDTLGSWMEGKRPTRTNHPYYQHGLQTSSSCQEDYCPYHFKGFPTSTFSFSYLIPESKPVDDRKEPETNQWDKWICENTRYFQQYLALIPDTTYKLSDKHYETCTKYYCPYHTTRKIRHYPTSKQSTGAKEAPPGPRPVRKIPHRREKTAQIQRNQKGTTSVNDQRLHHSRQQMDANKKRREEDTSRLLQKVQQGFSSLSIEDTPPALPHNDPSTERQRTHATQPQSGQVGTLLT